MKDGYPEIHDWVALIAGAMLLTVTILACKKDIHDKDKKPSKDDDEGLYYQQMQNEQLLYKQVMEMPK